MTPEAQRIAIAKVCGWEWMAGEELDISADQYGWGKIPISSKDWRAGIGFQQLPNYCEDLNAVHEAEKVLNKTLRLFYQSRLMKSQKADLVAGFWFLIHATAAQRAEAFLRTLNLWEE